MMIVSKMKATGFAAVAVLSIAVAMPNEAAAGTSQAIFAYTLTTTGPTDLVVTTTTGMVTFSSTDTGWYSQSGQHFASVPNYIAGICGSSDVCFGDDLNYHNFFVFDISGLTGDVQSAYLSLFNPAQGSDPAGYISTNLSETYTVFDVETNIGSLTSDQVSAVGTFNDLGSGVVYGSQVVSAADNGQQVIITLNAAALAAIQSADDEIAFGGAVNVAPVPVPAALPLFAAGLGALAVFARRRARR